MLRAREGVDNATGDARERSEPRPRQLRNARMDPMHDDTFETTRDRYNDLVTRIEEARAAYLESVEKIKWALSCL